MFGLKAQLKRLGREGDATPEFQAALLRRLTGVPVARHAFRFAVVGVTSVALVFGMGTGVYAYSSPDVNEGTALYPVKRGMEAVEGTFAITSDARAAFHARMMGRRMEEAERIIDHEDRVATTLQRAADELDMSVNELKAGLKDPSERQELIDELSSNNERYANLLDRVPNDSLPRRMMLPPPDRLRERVRDLRPMMRP